MNGSTYLHTAGSEPSRCQRHPTVAVTEYNPRVSWQPAKRKRSGRHGDPVSLYPLTMDQAADVIFAIKPDDVRKILAKRPGRKKK